ncbi:hypothetical protein P153DRAFT_392913 [Dothidotthia symphoricarpi CBS 119687]|uniref:Uncharacterized protein n=1 Tax=Dothidotthia symphoricarpi CBS 119687 TaxID=1392245 RepID=A0A6A6ATM3_9PLEO|nr:uncharacterized protein P153DRAFT_392913 [Dothidotthia symphoricarpi CBS 119687]KAF2134314.1 hypothetical protein P153DRAFT_392913 [Dothidotthia symphoricarpi CBS 119687]
MLLIQAVPSARCNFIIQGLSTISLPHRHLLGIPFWFTFVQSFPSTLCIVTVPSFASLHHHLRRRTIL